MSVVVYPVGDIKEHDIYSTTCECNPKVECEPDSDMLIIHNSFDGREAVEQANKILSEVV